MTESNLELRKYCLELAISVNSDVNTIVYTATNFEKYLLNKTVVNLSEALMRKGSTGNPDEILRRKEAGQSAQKIASDLGLKIRTVYSTCTRKRRELGIPVKGGYKDNSARLNAARKLIQTKSAVEGENK